MSEGMSWPVPVPYHRPDLDATWWVMPGDSVPPEWTQIRGEASTVIDERDEVRRQLAWLTRQIEHWLNAKHDFKDDADEALERAYRKALKRSTR